MAKLYFKYGCMGSSKTAQALMTKFNYEQQGTNVWLIKPAVDKRDGANIIKSRIGLSAEACPIAITENILATFIAKKERGQFTVIIADECQFFTEIQIDQLRQIADMDIPVLCYGLKTDFTTHLFEGSKRLLEVADSISEIKTVCKCGEKAIFNVRVEQGKIVTAGEKILMGGDGMYYPICSSCRDMCISQQERI